MALWFPKDYNETVRQTGFHRYEQLLARHFWQWWRLNLLTLLGFLPLAAGVLFAILSSSLLVLLPCSILGGVIAGPFLAGMVDAMLRGMRDAPGRFWENYRRAWRQNWRDSLIPGALTGLMAGFYAFLWMLLFEWSETLPSAGTVVVCLLALLLLLVFSTLYWPQLVLFNQSAGVRLRNCLLFCIKHFWRVMLVGLLQLIYLALYVLFAPWSLLLLLIIGVWYIVFLSQLLLYTRLDTAFHIEDSHSSAPAPSAEPPQAGPPA